MKPDKSFYIIYVMLVIMTAIWVAFILLVSYKASAAPLVKRNPSHIPVILPCTTYTVRRDCGRRFRAYLDLYDWRLCQITDPGYTQCLYWFDDNGLLLILNNLPGWHL